MADEIVSAGALAAEPQVVRPTVGPLDESLHRSYSVVVASLRFEWDARKSAANERKHGISFEEAETVFTDEQGLLLNDPEHSQDEARFILIGLSASVRALVVCHCYREADEVIRLISARKATRSERRQYGQRWMR